LLIKLQPGTPLSRAKDQVIRDAEATTEMVAQIVKTVITADIAVAPAIDLTPCWKIAMNGNPVVVPRTVVKSPRQNRMAISIPNPSTPLRKILNIIALGTTLDALLISSDIYNWS
jgi:hypothetical protein